MTVTLRRPAADEYAGWESTEIAAYADHMVESGAMSQAAAEERSRQVHSELLPDGLATPGQLVFRVESDGEPVGWVWLAVQARGAEQGVGYVYLLEVGEPFRGQGFGRAAMQLVEVEARRRGLTALQLNVFGHNVIARSLYAGLGYQEISVSMKKRL